MEHPVYCSICRLRSFGHSQETKFSVYISHFAKHFDGGGHFHLTLFEFNASALGCTGTRYKHNQVYVGISFDNKLGRVSIYVGNCLEQLADYQK